jgi:hypothetical protein
MAVSNTIVSVAQTPQTGIQGPEPEIKEAEGVRQLLWGNDATPLDETESDPLDETESDPGTWVPVSLRYVETPDDFYIFFELRNTSESDVMAPILVIDLSIEGTSYGTEEIRADNLWAPAGGSVFYHTLSFYGGSLGIGDWDREQFSVKPDPYADPPSFDPSLIRVEDDRVHNDGQEPLGEVSFSAIVRDEAGIFTATCSGPYTGAITPPGRSVKLSSPMDEETIPQCGFFFAGDPASEALGIGAPYRTEYVLEAIR